MSQLIFNKIFTAEKQARSVRLQLDGKVLTTPIYFPSISSVATHHNVDSLTELIIRSSYPYLLLSAYDIFHKYRSRTELVKAINDYHNRGILFLDSGGFEAYWNNDKDWKFGSYADTAKNVNCSIFTSFDPTVNVPDKEEDFKRNLFQSISSSASISDTGHYMPIFHSRTPEGLIESLSDYLHREPRSSQFIAVTERECGLTLHEKARTIFRLRQQIDNFGNDQILHVLGCGHPLSMALYCYCGADSFDSRDWMKAAVDRGRGTLTDLSHLDLLNCECRACAKTSHPIAKVFLHNLEMYMQLMDEIAQLIKTNTLVTFLQDKVGAEYLNHISSI